METRRSIESRLITSGTIDEIKAQTETKILEDAFTAITGGAEEKELLAWREKKGAST